MSKAKFQAVREFIQEKRFAEARVLLQTIDHPTAREWLVKLDKVEAARKPNGNKPLTCPYCGNVIRSRRFAALFGSRKKMVKCKKCGYQWQPNKSTQPSQVSISQSLPSQPTSALTDTAEHKAVTASQTLGRNGSLELNEDFIRIFDHMEQTNDCLFVTGKAGTGKSTLLKYFVENTHKRVVVLAPTGVAALNARGQTIHKFFRFPARMLSQDEIKRVRDAELYKKLDTIIIDEISMVRVELTDNIDRFLRLNREQFSLPFGGVQMIFFGDLYQLPPVVKETEVKQHIASRYRSEYFFDANVFSHVKLHIEELQRVYRQSNPEFVSLLNAVRTGEITEGHINQINSRYNPAFIPNQHSPYITLTTKNDLARRTNEEFLECIPSASQRYVGIKGGDFKDENLPVELELTLKVDAQVMFVKNDTNGRWVNGTLGKVRRLSENSIEVEINANGRKQIYAVTQERWENIQYRLDDETVQIKADVVGFYLQYPLKLAWAITIHKSQGATYERAIVDFGDGAFATGQAYVALSRCKTLDGIVLRTKLTMADIKIDPKVQNFMKARRKTPAHVGSIPLELGGEVVSEPVVSAPATPLTESFTKDWDRYIEWVSGPFYGDRVHVRTAANAVAEFMHPGRPKNPYAANMIGVSGYLDHLRSGRKIKLDRDAETSFICSYMVWRKNLFGLPYPSWFVDADGE
jgi:GTPase SAR1 family protein